MPSQVRRRDRSGAGPWYRRQGGGVDSTTPSRPHGFNLGEGKFRPLGSAGAVGTNTNLIHLGTALAAGVTALVETTDRLVACPDPERGLANAFPYLTVFGHTVVGWLWVEQALAAQRGLEASPGDPFYLGKLAAVRYFLDWVLAATQPTHQLLRRLDETPLSMQPEWY